VVSDSGSRRLFPRHFFPSELPSVCPSLIAEAKPTQDRVPVSPGSYVLPNTSYWVLASVDGLSLHERLLINC
jgi:hypothetical protein